MQPWTLKTAKSELTLMEELTFLAGRRIVARHFEYTITLRCANRCLSCPQPRMRRDIPWAIVARGLEEYARRPDRRLGSMELVLTGGEPTLSESVLDIIRLGLRLGFGSVSVISSSERFADPGLARAILEAGVRRVLLSFHSRRPRTYHRFTGSRGQFERAVAGLRNCLRLPFAQVTCNTLINRHNYRDLPAHADFLASVRDGSGAQAPLSLLLSVLEENPLWDSLCVPHRAAAPYVRRVFESGTLPLRRFVGDWTMPVCVAGLGPAAAALAPLARRDSPAWYAPEGWTPGFAPPPEGCRRVKAAACRGCPLDPVCAGLSRVYAGRFGSTELVPVPGRFARPVRAKEVLPW